MLFKLITQRSKFLKILQRSMKEEILSMQVLILIMIKDHLITNWKACCTRNPGSISGKKLRLSL